MSSSPNTKWFALALVGSLCGVSPSPSAEPGALRPALVALSVVDLDASVRWYEDVLGFRVVDRMAFPDYKLRIGLLERDGFRFELVEIAGSKSPAELVPGIDNPALIRGFGKLAFEVDELESWVARLRAKGARIQLGPQTDPKDGSRSCIVLDNEGNWLQFGTPPQVAPAPAAERPPGPPATPR